MYNFDVSGIKHGARGVEFAWTKHIILQIKNDSSFKLTSDY